MGNKDNKNPLLKSYIRIKKFKKLRATYIIAYHKFRMHVKTHKVGVEKS